MLVFQSIPVRGHWLGMCWPAWFLPLTVEIVGFGGRIISSTEAPLFTDTPYIIQNLFLLLAPALFAASIYMQLGRLIILLEAEHHSIVRRSWMTKIFVTGDILSFVVQGLGRGDIVTRRYICVISTNWRFLCRWWNYGKRQAFKSIARRKNRRSWSDNSDSVFRLLHRCVRHYSPSNEDPSDNSVVITSFLVAKISVQPLCRLHPCHDTLHL